ncbi:MAG: hypothetical protein WA755_10375 [Candidatus Acidiferrales bacterium]
MRSSSPADEAFSFEAIQIGPHGSLVPSVDLAADVLHADWFAAEDDSDISAIPIDVLPRDLVEAA